MRVKLEVGDLSIKVEKTYEKLTSLYDSYEKKENLEELTSKYKEIDKSDMISIAFIGQYSSGKSTIIKALTGEKDILIDADIATGAVTSYEWGSGIWLVDTPGLKTGEKEEHDKMTQEEIERADLLVYCITSDLFSNITRDDFKALAEQYRTKLFLVINKMSAETGEYDQLVENYSDSINRTLSPQYAITDFYHFFIDAKDYLQGITDNDQDYIDDSYFETFIQNLNRAIEMKRIGAKLLTPINILKNSVDNTLIGIEADEHIKDGKYLIKRICDTIEEKKQIFMKVSNEDVQKTANKLIYKGDDVAMHLGEKGYEFNEKAFQDFFEPLQCELKNNIQGYFEQYAEEVDTEVRKVMVSEMAQHFFREQKHRLNKEYKNNKSGSEVLINIDKSITQTVSDVAPKITDWLGKAANVSEGSKISIWTVNGSDLHKMVKNVGHKFGYKFKPFEAMKITKKIANVSNLLGPILTGVGVVVEGAIWIAEKLGEKKTKKIKSEIKSVFKEVSEDTVKYYNEQIISAAKEFDAVRDSLQEELMKLDEESGRNDEFSKSLYAIKNELLDLQKQIEMNHTEYYN